MNYSLKASTSTPYAIPGDNLTTSASPPGKTDSTSPFEAVVQTNGSRKQIPNQTTSSSGYRASITCAKFALGWKKRSESTSKKPVTCRGTTASCSVYLSTPVSRRRSCTI